MLYLNSTSLSLLVDTTVACIGNELVHLIRMGKCVRLNRGSCMSAHVLLILLNQLDERDKMQGLSSILTLFAMSIINSIRQEHECKILFIILHKGYFKISFLP